MSTAYNDPRILRGMEAQLKLRQERLDGGEKSIGWKAGFGAPAAMERLGIDAPLIGFLTSRTLLPSGATVSIRGWVKGAAEPEIAITLGEDLPGGADEQTARRAIASLGPAIELADVSFPADEVEAILAGNIYNRHVILGRTDASRAGCALDGLVGRVARVARVARGGVEMDPITDVQALTGNLVGIVRHIADVLAACGETLRAGEVIIAGSIIPPLWLAEKEEIRYTLDPVDTLSVILEP